MDMWFINVYNPHGHGAAFEHGIVIPTDDRIPVT